MISRFVRRHILVSFFVLAYALSWTVYIPLALSAHELIPALPPGLHFVGAYGPMVAAFILTGLTEGASGMRDLLRRMVRWRVGSVWLLVAAFSPVILFLISVLIIRITSGMWPDLGQFGYIAELPNLGWCAGWITWTLTFGLGEEVGWRGFALPHLQQSRSARSATLILGGMWAFWHLPQFFYNYEMTPFGVFGFVVSLMSGAVVLTWLYNTTGGSVLITSLWHGAFNTVVAGAQETLVPLVNGLVILAAVLIAHRTGPEAYSFAGKHIIPEHADNENAKTRL